MSVRKDLTVGPIIALILILVIIVVVFVILPAIQTTVDLRLSDGIFRARIATDENDRQKAIPSTTKLDNNQAVLLAFPSEGEWGVAVKDVKVSADVVWLDKDKKVINAVTDISPDEFNTKIYYSQSSAKYLIEFPAGTVKSKAINKGDTATFEIKDGDIK